MKLEFADAAAARKCTVSIDGDEIRIEDLDQPIRLRAGRHQLRIRQGDMEIQTREFDVLSHGAQVMHVSLPTHPAEAVVAPLKASFDPKEAREYQERFSRHSGLPLEIINSIGMKLVLIPSGEFEMGSPDDLIATEMQRPDGWYTSWYRDHLPTEAPGHHMRITRPFYFGVCPVTQGEYERVTGGNPSEFPSRSKGQEKIAADYAGRFPVDDVTWYTRLNSVACYRGCPRKWLQGAGTSCPPRRNGSMPAARATSAVTDSVEAAEPVPMR